MMIITGPPTNSANVNCHPSSSAKMMPSSITRFVLAISKTIAAVKLDPLRNKERASATAAYEQDEDAAPNPVARASVTGRSSPSSRATVSFRTTAWMTAESVKPRISDQVICQVIDAAVLSALPNALSSDMSGTFRGNGEQLAKAVLEQLVRESVGQPVVDHPAVAPRLDQPRRAQQPECVRRLVLADVEGQCQVPHAELVDGLEREEDARPDRVSEQREQPSKPLGLSSRERLLAGGLDPVSVHRMFVIQHIRIVARTCGWFKRPDPGSGPKPAPRS